ncbi:Uncharacterized protein SCF082_LOCUS11746 [Durusdinium trenchii]|uniref:Uncharacterized protein n=1 Tax=Durusdinium trenchii TaxID=1381693 RepID=A0ABP0JFR1_9DINO
MGIGRNRLHKVDCGNPDLRFGKREYRSKALTWSVDSFLQIAYDRIAETLPDKFIRRGRASKPPASVDFDDDDRDSNYEEVESDVDIEELSTWLNTNHSVQSGYSTFNAVFKLRWKDILHFRSRSNFSQCEICQLLKGDLSSRTLNFDQRLGALHQYRDHLYQQYCDRTVAWKMQACSAEPTSDLLVISIDGLADNAFWANAELPELSWLAQDRHAALQSPVLKKAEEKATVKREDGKSNEESPSAKRLCGIYEKKVSQWYKDYAAMRGLPHLFKELSPPADGLAVIEDWMTCFESMLFGGVDLSREPIDGNVTLNMDNARVNFRNISLSYRGSERQPPSSLQLALRMSAVMEQRQSEGRHPADWSVEQRLRSVVDELHDQGGLASKHWVDEERFRSLHNLISGTTVEARDVMAAHLHRHKWRESAFSVEQLKSSRWLVGSSPKMASCPVRGALTVAPESRVLHLQLVVHQFCEAGKKLRPSARPKMRLSSDAFDKACDFACIYTSVLQEARSLTTFTKEKEAEILRIFLQRDYMSEIDASVSSKLSTWQVQHLSLWTDYVDTKAAAVVANAEQVAAMEDEAQSAKYREVKAKLLKDQAAMTHFNACVNQNSKRKHVVKVMHERAQVQCGKQLSETFMEKWNRVSLVPDLKSMPNLDAAYKLLASHHKVPVEDVNTIMYVDCTKFGVLNQPEINAIGEMVERVLFRNPYRGGLRSVAVVLPPLLCGSTGGGSLRADWRYCQSPLWMKQSLVNFPEAIEEKNFIVPGEMMTSNEARRNLSDVQETSQWLGGIHVPREVLVALQGTEKFVKPTLVVHPSAYDGALELAAMHMGFGSFSYSTQEVHFKCSKEIVKNSLVEAWKQGKSPMDKITPKYRRDPPQEEMPSSVDAPNLEICQLADGKLLLPTDVRQHFLQCPIWGNDWRKELQSFDAAWGTNAATTPTVAEPVAKKEEAAAGSADGRTQCFFPNEPASIDAVKAKYGDVIAEVPIPDAPIVLVVLPGSILFARATEATTLRAADGPILSHGPGSWLIGDKATKYDQQNAGKGLFCRWENDEGIVVLEEWDLGLMFFIAKGF